MFDETLLESSPSRMSVLKSHHWLTSALAGGFEAAVIAAAVVIPLIYTEALPKMDGVTRSIPPPPAFGQSPAAKAIRRNVTRNRVTAPVIIPRTIAPLRDENEPPQPEAPAQLGVPTGLANGGIPNGVAFSLFDGSASPLPPALPARAATPKRIQVGGQVEAAKVIFSPPPEYPPLAKMARVEGVVRLEAVISKEGAIQDLKVIQGHALLVRSVLEAVSRWRYQPTLLNGDPVEVVTEIVVDFKLSD